MTRENFRIAYRGKETIKHKFNSACREIERIINDIAIVEHTAYSLTGKSMTRAGSYVIAGSRQWTGNNGNVVDFTITKL